MQYFTYTVCNGLLLHSMQHKNTLLFFAFFTMWMKNISQTDQISSFWFVFLSVLFPTNLRCNISELNKICKVQLTVIENKSRCRWVTWVRKLFSPPVCPHQTLNSIIFHSFTEVDVWCVNRATEPKQNNFELRSKQPTCVFNLDTPSTPRAFFSLYLNCCHAADFFPP